MILLENLLQTENGLLALTRKNYQTSEITGPLKKIFLNSLKCQHLTKMMLAYKKIT